MGRGLGAQLFALLTGGLIGYLQAWIWGWSLFDPNSDVWALAALIGALAGMVIGLWPACWRFAGVLAGGSLGLYVGWVARTWLFGDTPGGWGVAVMTAGMLVGGWVGAPAGTAGHGTRLGALLGALYAGLLGGFMIDVVMLDMLTGWVSEHSILGQAPAVLLCGLVGGLLGGRLGSSRRAKALNVK